MTELRLIGAGGGGGSIDPIDPIYYVDLNAAPGGDGSIAAPFQTITDGIAAIATGVPVPLGALFVVPGNYTAEGPIVLPDGVGVYLKLLAPVDTSGIGLDLDSVVMSPAIFNTFILDGTNEGQVEPGLITVTGSSTATIVMRGCQFGVDASGSTAPAGQVTVQASDCSITEVSPNGYVLDGDRNTNSADSPLDVPVLQNCSVGDFYIRRSGRWEGCTFANGLQNFLEGDLNADTDGFFGCKIGAATIQQDPAPVAPTEILTVDSNTHNLGQLGVGTEFSAIAPSSGIDRDHFLIRVLNAETPYARRNLNRFTPFDADTFAYAVNFDPGPVYENPSPDYPIVSVTTATGAPATVNIPSGPNFGTRLLPGQSFTQIWENSSASPIQFVPADGTVNVYGAATIPAGEAALIRYTQTTIGTGDWVVIGQN